MPAVTRHDKDPLNLVLVSLDTVRADVAFSGIFPNIEDLRSGGISFLSAISSSPLTPVSHASLLTGLEPPSHGIRHLWRERLSAGVETLASVLTRNGYVTGAVVSSPGVNRWYGFDQGFAHYDDWTPKLADGRDALEVVDVELRGTAMKRASDVVDRALTWVRSVQSRPLFLFAHFFDAHWPYEAPDDFGVACKNEYEREVAYTDHHLGSLLSGLDALGIDSGNSIVVCFADHGEDLSGLYENDHGGDMGHPEERGHGCLLYDTTQRVPLIIRSPAQPRGRSLEVQVRLVDVVPTLADLLQIDFPQCDGRSLAPALRGETLPSVTSYSETYYPEELASSSPEWRHLSPLKAIRTPSTKVIWEVNTDRVHEFDLLADPFERTPHRIAGA